MTDSKEQKTKITKEDELAAMKNAKKAMEHLKIAKEYSGFAFPPKLVNAIDNALNEHRSYYRHRNQKQ